MKEKKQGNQQNLRQKKKNNPTTLLHFGKGGMKGCLDLKVEKKV